MGPTGAGKSSFVNQAVGRPEAVGVGHDLKSCTTDVQAVRYPHSDGHRNIVLVDTPGFDDTCVSDTQILRTIADWLNKTYKQKIKLAGLLYLHRISDVRFGGTPLRNLSVFKDLCGVANLQNVILVTTMWDEVGDSDGSLKEAELVSKFWNGMIQLGSRTRRFDRTQDSPWEIINSLNLKSLKDRKPLQIQQEMVDQGLPLEKTTAGKTLLRLLSQLFDDVKGFFRGFGKRSSRRTAATKKPTEDNLRRRTFLSRRSSTRSSASSASSGTDDAAIFSSSGSSRETDASSIQSSTRGSSSSCSLNGRKDLLATITGLKLAYQIADLASIPFLKGAIGLALNIAQSVDVSTHSFRLDVG
ncbi:hypothetical protein HYDPIDRAFT_91834 [Hydnomerulius pinastri MD-312]|uniref:G domain-containing protein n=1 Tax=Hydnomerulius pinastri MD-312 TaxID=994086 RepID=A0A0C9WF01_9AGAM|nr:hypothetical protein HYDPIDRAFT_91834 [Hydnomerulius pinastri MD-312]